MWLAFAQEQSLRWVSIHNLHNNVGQEVAEATLFLHALKGCDISNQKQPQSFLN